MKSLFDMVEERGWRSRIVPIGRLADLRKAVVLVTHDLAEAAFFAGRLVLLRDGRVVQEGSLAELVSAPADAFVTRFVRAHRTLSLEAEAPP